VAAPFAADAETIRQRAIDEMWSYQPEDQEMTTEDTGEDHLPVLVSTAPDLADLQFDRGFDYDALPSDMANALRERRANIRRAVKKTTEAIIAIGHDLIAAKKVLGHGRFGDWVEMECGFSIRTAQNYIAISRLSTKYAFVAHLALGTVLRLTRRRVPREFLDSILSSLGAGRRLTEDEFCALHQKFKEMRELEPKRPRGRRSQALPKPVERPSEQYRGHTKTEWAKMNAEYIERREGYLGLLEFRRIVLDGTLTETLQFVEARIHRLQFERGLADLREPATPE
jgi:hypothetical protein